jgi:hypothetical protein
VELDLDFIEKLPEGFNILREYLRNPRSGQGTLSQSEAEQEMKYHGITYLGQRHHRDRYHIQYGYGPFLEYKGAGY